jgi:catechol 2,3-dioxygenase-like lactoylglutathione lyase family enzyme
VLSTGVIATIHVSDLDRAVDFYTRALELPLAGRSGEHYAALDLVAVLHPGRRW